LLLKAATATFLETGYDAASLDQIADEAGIARRTIYNQFANKEALYRAVIEDLAESLFPLPTGDLPTEDVREGLKALAHWVVRSLSEPTSIAFIRMMVMQNGALRRITQDLYAERHARLIDSMVSHFRLLSHRGILRADDLRLAAFQFLGLFSEDLIWPRILGGRNRLTSARVNNTIDQAIEVFVAFYSHCREHTDGAAATTVGNID